MGRGLAWVCGSGWDPLWGGTVGKNCLDLLALKQGILSTGEGVGSLAS